MASSRSLLVPVAATAPACLCNACTFNFALSVLSVSVGVGPLNGWGARWGDLLRSLARQAGMNAQEQSALLQLDVLVLLYPLPLVNSCLHIHHRPNEESSF